jgi:hypothetical protein
MRSQESGVRSQKPGGVLRGALAGILLATLPACAAISGVIVNGTTGKPEAGITVTLLKMTAKGPQPAGETKADAQGAFKLDQSVDGPTLVRATLDGVTYNHVLAPGMPSEGINLEVYNASKEPGEAKVSKHMLLFEPTGQQLVVNEAFIVSNTGKTAWNDPADGTLHIFLPRTIDGQAQISATPPGGQPLQQVAEKTGQPDVFKINFPMRPGETRVDVAYTLPYKEGEAFAGKVPSKDDSTYLIVPEGVTMKADDIRGELLSAYLKDLGQEPRTRAHIYGLKGTDYKIELTGTVSERNADSDAQVDTSGQPQVQQIMPRIYTQTKLILPLALGILALGFILLYRMPGLPEGKDAKETNARARR